MRSGIAAGVKDPAAARRCEAARTGQKKSRAMGEGQKKALFSSGPSCREDGAPWNSATNHERLLGHARAHVSSPDLVTHIAQHDAGLRAATAGRNAKVRGLGVVNSSSSFRVSLGRGRFTTSRGRSFTRPIHPFDDASILPAGPSNSLWSNWTCQR